MSEASRVRVIPFANDELDRVETGAVQFGNDWPGLFVRGDSAFAAAFAIEAIERFLCTLPAAIKATADTELDAALSSLTCLTEIIRRDVIVTTG